MRDNHAMSPAMLCLLAVVAAQPDSGEGAAAPSPGPAASAQALPISGRVEVGGGVGLIEDRVGLIPRLRGGATIDVGVPNLVVGGDIAAEGFIVGDDGGAFFSSTYWEAMLTPRAFVGYRVPLESFALQPYGFLAVGAGMRVTTVEVFGRTDDTTDIIWGGRAGLGFAFIIQMFMLSIEMDAGLKDLGPIGSATLNAGVQF
jgi:hypothetical protein